MERNEQQIKSHLQRISDILLINGGFLDNPGLYTGEMGIVLFFSHYYGFTKNDLYLECSFNLIEKIQNRIHQDTPINYKQGLAGIGAAVEYLTQNGYIEADTDDILDEFDNRIFFTCNLSYLPIDLIMDIGYYVIWRISGVSSKKGLIQQSVLPPIIKVMSEWSTKNKLTLHPTVSFFKEIASDEDLITKNGSSIVPVWLHFCCKNSPYGLNAKSHESILKKFSNTDSINMKSIDLGIQNGLAGLGLTLLTELDGDDTWTALFPNDLISIKYEPLPL